MSESSRMYLEAGEPKCEGNRSPSAVIGLRVLDDQPVEKLLSCPFGTERVKDRVLPVLRDDLAFALRLCAAIPPDDDGQTPLVAQASPGRIVAPFGHLPDGLPQAAQERASRTHPPGRVEKHNGVRAFEAKVECLVVVAVRDPRVAGEQAALLVAPLGLRRRNPAGLPEMEVEIDDRQAGLRTKRARERALPGTSHPSHEDAAAYPQGCIAHRRQCPSSAASGASTEQHATA